MKKVNHILVLSLVLFSVLLSSCEKEGPAGEDGKDGNANVVSSTFTATNWNYIDPNWQAGFTYPAITQEIINSGAVLVYVQDGNTQSQLPITIPQGGYTTTVAFNVYPGGGEIIWIDSDLTQPDYPGTLTFKIVVISADGLTQNPNVDLTNYEEVKEVFDL